MSACHRLLLSLTLLGAGCSPKDIELTSSGRDGGPGHAGVIVTDSVTLPGVPDGAERLFREDTGDDIVAESGVPEIVYPSHETMFPRNIERVLHQWRAPDRLDLFEVRFDSDLARVRFYTTDRSLLPDTDGWRTLAATHAGGSLQMTVRGLRQDAPDDIYRSQPVTLHYSRSEVLGALYYWSTGTSGVMRAHIAAATATKFFTDPAAPDGQTCVGCHTVSRDGRRLAAGYDGERLRAVTIPERALLIPEVAGPVEPMPMEGPGFGWGTFSPDGTRLLYAHKGALTVLDADNGQTVAQITLPAGFHATHPDWSPDGRYVAIAYVERDRDISNKDVTGSSIARLAVNDDGTFGEPELIVPSEDKDDTLFFPVYSPDSRWLAFVRGHGKSKDSKSAELFVIDADGEGEPVALERLNRRVGNDDGVNDLGNTMPTWAPSTRPDVFWLAFSSLRDYGEVLVEAERDQLWAAAIDPTRIEEGDDPSYAAFWLPFQDVNEGNHRAFWALAPEEECPSAIEICDQLDSDCDGVVDEDCCSPANEVCGDGIDNDCNGVPDEHCDCGEVEICDNAVDDDCDVAIDEDCVI